MTLKSKPPLISLFALLPLFFLATGFSLEPLKNGLLFHPRPEYEYSPGVFKIKYDEVKLTAASGIKLNAWHIPGGQGPTFLLLSGNGGNMTVMLNRISYFHELGYSSLTVDYPGFGQSEGKPSEEGTYEAAEAAWRYLTEAKKIKPEQIIIYGFSLGGGVATWLAQKHRSGGLVLDSTFTRVAEVGKSLAPEMADQVETLLGQSYDSQSRLADIQGPLLVIHSRGDKLVPYQQGQALFESYNNGPKTMVSGQGDHMDFLLNRSEYLPAIKTFVKSIESGK
jgi:alpha/beta hydrolase fold.